MAFRVRTTAKAKRNLGAVLAWLIANESGDVGLRWFGGLQDAMASLAEMPERCPVQLIESKALSRELRQLLYGNKPHSYRILFTIEEDVATVLTVRYGRRLS